MANAGAVSGRSSGSATRRRWRVRLALVLGVTAMGCGSPAPSVPNIVLAIGDDHGFSDFGFMGSPDAITPRLDAIAAEGFVFNTGYSTASSCRSALRTLLTGLHPNQYEVRVTRHKDVHGDGLSRSTRRFETLPRVLGRHGYVSFQAGKHWEGSFADAGFDAGTKFEASGSEAPPGKQILRDGMTPLFDFIDAHRERPFFVWYAPKVPHLPHDAPAKYAEPYRARGVSEVSIPYLASVSWFDDGLGQLVDHLDHRGLRERTLIVYLADNGWQRASADSAQPQDRNVASLGGPSGKLSLYDPGFRTPIVIRWPGTIAGGRTTEVLVSAADIYPTILAAAGVAAPADRAGQDLGPVLRGEQEPRSGVVIGQMAGLRSDRRDGTRVSLKNVSAGGNFYRDPTWHYLAYARREPELYRIGEDPQERNNLAAARPDVVARLTKRIQAWRRALEVAPAADSPEL